MEFIIFPPYILSSASVFEYIPKKCIIETDLGAGGRLIFSEGE